MRHLPSRKQDRARSRPGVRIAGSERSLSAPTHTDSTVTRLAHVSMYRTSRAPHFIGRKHGIETHLVVELLEVDDGAVLALLERLVGARAVVVRHPLRAATLLRVALLRAIPAACHANPRTLVSHPTRPDGGGPRPAPPRTGAGRGGAVGRREGGGRGPRGEYLRRRGAWARRRRRRTGRRGGACSCRRRPTEASPAARIG